MVFIIGDSEGDIGISQQHKANGLFTEKRYKLLLFMIIATQIKLTMITKGYCIMQGSMIVLLNGLLRNKNCYGRTVSAAGK